MNVEFRCRGRLILEVPVVHGSYFIPRAFIHEGVLYGVACCEQNATGDVTAECTGPPNPTMVERGPDIDAALAAETAKECGRVGCEKLATTVARWGKRSWASCDDHRNELEPYCEFEPIQQVREREGNANNCRQRAADG